MSSTTNRHDLERTVARLEEELEMNSEDRIFSTEQPSRKRLVSRIHVLWSSADPWTNIFNIFNHLVVHTGSVRPELLSFIIVFAILIFLEITVGVIDFFFPRNIPPGITDPKL